MKTAHLKIFGLAVAAVMILFITLLVVFYKPNSTAHKNESPITSSGAQNDDSSSDGDNNTSTFNSSMPNDEYLALLPLSEEEVVSAEMELKAGKTNTEKSSPTMKEKKQSEVPPSSMDPSEHIKTSSDDAAPSLLPPSQKVVEEEDIQETDEDEGDHESEVEVITPWYIDALKITPPAQKKAKRQCRFTPFESIKSVLNGKFNLNLLAQYWTYSYTNDSVVTSTLDIVSAWQAQLHAYLNSFFDSLPLVISWTAKADTFFFLGGREFQFSGNSLQMDSTNLLNTLWSSQMDMQVINTSIVELTFHLKNVRGSLNFEVRFPNPTKSRVSKTHLNTTVPLHFDFPEVTLVMQVNILLLAKGLQGFHYDASLDTLTLALLAKMQDFIKMDYLAPSDTLETIWANDLSKVRDGYVLFQSLWNRIFSIQVLQAKVSTPAHAKPRIFLREHSQHLFDSNELVPNHRLSKSVLHIDEMLMNAFYSRGYNQHIDTKVFDALQHELVPNLQSLITGFMSSRISSTSKNACIHTRVNQYDRSKIDLKTASMASASALGSRGSSSPSSTMPDPRMNANIFRQNQAFPGLGMGARGRTTRFNDLNDRDDDDDI